MTICINLICGGYNKNSERKAVANENSDYELIRTYRNMFHVSSQKAVSYRNINSGSSVEL